MITDQSTKSGNRNQNQNRLMNILPKTRKYVILKPANQVEWRVLKFKKGPKAAENMGF